MDHFQLLFISIGMIMTYASTEEHLYYQFVYEFASMNEILWKDCLIFLWIFHHWCGTKSAYTLLTIEFSFLFHCFNFISEFKNNWEESFGDQWWKTLIFYTRTTVLILLRDSSHPFFFFFSDYQYSFHVNIESNARKQATQ